MSSSSTLSGRVLTGTAKTPFWLWPNLLSVDAPIISALWQHVFARDAGVNLSLASRAALPLAVWLIYLVDRLLDTAGGMNKHATARHAFYRTHRRFCYGLSAFAAVLLSISVVFLPSPVFRNGLLVSCAVAVYLAIVHSTGSWRFPKEVAVGLMFAVGTVLAPFTRAANATILLLPVFLFGLLCWLNCSVIEISEGGQIDSVSTWLVRHMKVVVISTCLLCLLLALKWLDMHSSLALLISAIGFWVFADGHPRWSNSDGLRVWLDLPLLTPLLLLTLK